ncbi:tryptophan synthase beta subunit-like PLP-dependent enzyme [Nemania abortiva]|nr:tryptophan synthase beta subunit-like PLP-dependent enzyme [Nemania abortiva]
MGSYVPDVPKLHIETPCIPSRELSRAAGCNIYLKLENLQPSGSFKSRGIGTLMSRALASSSTGRAHFYCSSGGNAGLACAEAARTLRQPCDVFVTSLTPEHVVARLKALGATPHRVGTSWPEADAQCQAAVAGDADGVYVPPFDHPLVWEGNSSLVDEIAALEAKGFFGVDGDGGVADAIVCNVGGGGLLNGIMEGIERNYGARSPSSSSHQTATSNGRANGSSGPSASRHRPAVLALETAGADSLAASIRAGSHVTIPGITSVATSLGAPRVSEQTYKWAEACNANSFTFTATSTSSFSSTFGRSTSRSSSSSSSSTSFSSRATSNTTTRLVSAVVSDADAVAACARFVDDARLLVEVACGATLSSAYNSRALLRAALAPEADDRQWAKMNVVLVVCGGSNISIDMLANYRKKFGV